MMQPEKGWVLTRDEALAHATRKWLKKARRALDADIADEDTRQVVLELEAHLVRYDAEQVAPLSSEPLSHVPKNTQSHSKL